MQPHLSRWSWYEYVVSSATARGIIPVVWDVGDKGNHTMSVFDRNTGAAFDLGLLNAIRSGAELSKLPGDTSLPQAVPFNNAIMRRASFHGNVFHSTLLRDRIQIDYFTTASGSAGQGPVG